MRDNRNPRFRRLRVCAARGAGRVSPYMSAGPSPNRPRCTLRGDGTASLDDRESRDILRSTQRKVVFSGAVAQPNEAPHAGYFAVLRG